MRQNVILLKRIAKICSKESRNFAQKPRKIAQKNPQMRDLCKAAHKMIKNRRQSLSVKPTDELQGLKQRAVCWAEYNNFRP